MNDEDRFFFEVTREAAIMDDINTELQILAEDAILAETEVVYREYIDAMLHSFYEENFCETEWDV